MVAGIELARGLGSEVIEVKCDSQLVVNQIHRSFDAIGEHMHQYLNKVQVLLFQFREWSVIHIPKEENMEADVLANLGPSMEIKGADSGVVVAFSPRCGWSCEVNLKNLVWDWRNEFIEYLRHGKLPDDSKASRVLRAKTARYCLVDGQLYRRSFLGLVARRLGPAEADYVIREVPEGICGNYSGPYLLVLKLMRGMDIVGPLSQGPVHVKYLLVLTDYFSKWVEAGSKVKKFLERLNIKRITSSSYHPSTNGQVESTNNVIIQNLKIKLGDAKGRWPEELPGVLWAYRTIEKSSTGEKPFFIVYRAKALIPMEIGELTMRFSWANEQENDKAMLVKLELLEEHRNLAYVRMMALKQMMERIQVHFSGV
ncbi:uncharacterized protein LOC142171906 [Nicotiana tabacum]|uniref:Uncharacterized protein LOC142171906 n=1 Tax=Nicotiana tabacum TaxID=4097 RepID=A0AC58T3A7_TOBAC